MQTTFYPAPDYAAAIPGLAQRLEEKRKEAEAAGEALARWLENDGAGTSAAVHEGRRVLRECRSTFNEWQYAKSLLELRGGAATGPVPQAALHRTLHEVVGIVGG